MRLSDRLTKRFSFNLRQIRKELTVFCAIPLTIVQREDWFDEHRGVGISDDISEPVFDLTLLKPLDIFCVEVENLFSYLIVVFARIDLLVRRRFVKAFVCSYNLEAVLVSCSSYHAPVKPMLIYEFTSLRNSFYAPVDLKL